MSQQDFLNLIQNKQLENTLKLAKTSKIKIGDKEYTKRPLSAKKWLEIVQLNQKMIDAKTELARTELLIIMRQKGALYYFGIPADVFDEHYEDIATTIEGHILRSNMGANSDVDFAELLKRFENFNSSSSSSVSPPPPILLEEKPSSYNHKGNSSNKKIKGNASHS